jgi:hypothetical protein
MISYTELDELWGQVSGTRSKMLMPERTANIWLLDEAACNERSGRWEPPHKEKSKSATRKTPHATKVAYPPLRRPSRGFARFATRTERAPLTAVLAAGKWQL